MDDALNEVEANLKATLDRAAQLAAEVGRRKQVVGQVPHYSQIESDAHAVAQRLGQAIQATRSEQVRQECEPNVSCPDCSGTCRVTEEQRRITSIDGPTEITEAVAYCRHCRRSFFPSA